MGANVWADATVQHFGSAEQTSWTTSSSTTDILPGSTVTLNGIVMTFGGSSAGIYDDQWVWVADNKGIRSNQMPNKGSNSTGYVNTDVAVGNTVPAFGGTYKFVPSQSGTLIVSGKGGGTGGDFVLVKVDGDNKITEIVKSESGTATTIDNTYNLVSGNIYYFFQCAIATGSVESGRYTLKKITYKKEMKLVDGFYYLGFPDGSYDARQKFIKIHNYNLGSLETYSGTKTKNPNSDGANLAGFSNTVTRYLIGTADTEGEYITGMTFAKSKYGWFVSSGYGLQNNDANASANITINDATGKVAVLSHKMGADPAVEWSTVEKEEESAIFDVDGTITLTLLNKNSTKIAYTDIDVYTPCPDNVSVTVKDAGFATYVPSYDLDFSETNIKAYKVKASTKGKATLTQVNNVPAGTPVLLYKAGGATEDIPVMTGATAFEAGTNDLVAGPVAELATIDGDYTNMILNNGSEGIGFYFANGQTVAANRAYLHIATSLAPDPVAGAPMMLVFDNETSGINEVQGAGFKVNGYYDLQGRKVAQPTKGLYIVNGKKVVIK